MTFTVSPWWVWAVLSLALFGLVFWWRVARGLARDLRLWWRGWRAGVTEAPWQRVWGWLRRDRVAPLLEDEPDYCECCEALGFDPHAGLEGGYCRGCGHWHGERLDLPPERSREELGFGMGASETARQWWLDHPGLARDSGLPPDGSLLETPIQIGEDMSWWTPGRERRTPWWEAEHRAAYESLGFDYPSGLMARVRELAS